jgi:hypothetical protein
MPSAARIASTVQPAVAVQQDAAVAALVDRE